MKLEYAAGATPLNPDESAGLIPIHIATQGELNEWEAQNILLAERWLLSKPHHFDVLTMDFAKLLHKKMFENTWKWAGKFRSSGKNIGVSPISIVVELQNLLDDAAYQIIHQSYSIDEIAYRFHYRLVWIHPFANGNGRHSRMMTDLLLNEMGEQPFTWGSANLINESVTRDQYIEALRDADKRDYTKLAKFVRS